MKLKEALAGKLTQKELACLRGAFDTVGSIAIIEIPRELVKKQKIIAQTLLKLHKNIRTVAKKAGKHEGIYRRQKIQILAGEKNKITEHTESGVKMRLDVEKCYFSPRLGSERLRIAKLVKPNESVLVMFSGIAPYPLVIAKHSKAKEIVGIELNPVAHNYAEQNVVLNKLCNRIKLYKGDARKIVPKLGQKFDRIVMPLPKTGKTFLPTAFKAAKKGTTIHFYDFEKEGEFELAAQKVLDACKKAGKKCKIINIVKAGQHAPRTFRICVDFKIL